MTRVILIFCFLFLFTSQLFADWPVGKRRTTIIPTYTFFHSSKFYDSTGKIISFNKGDHFNSQTINTYIVHGISRRLDLIVNIPYTFISTSFNKVTQSKSGISDIYLGFAYHFPASDLKKYVTTKAMFIIDGYQNNSVPYLGYSALGFQLAANYSVSIADQTFFVAEGSYTHYFMQTGPNQYGYNLTVGNKFGKFNYVTANLIGTFSQSTNKTFINTNLAHNEDFSYGKLSVAYGRRISRVATPYLQAFYTFYGRKAGVGLGISAFVIFKLP